MSCLLTPAHASCICSWSERKEYAYAVEVMSQLPSTPESDALWRSLAESALSDGKLSVAECCFAKLGDIAKSRYLHKASCVNSVRCIDIQIKLQ